MEYKFKDAVERALLLAEKIQKFGAHVQKLPEGEKSSRTKAKQQKKALEKELNSTIRFDVDFKEAMLRYPKEVQKQLEVKGYNIPPSKFLSHLAKRIADTTIA